MTEAKYQVATLFPEEMPVNCVDTAYYVFAALTSIKLNVKDTNPGSTFDVVLEEGTPRIVTPLHDVSKRPEDEVYYLEARWDKIMRHVVVYSGDHLYTSWRTTLGDKDIGYGPRRLYLEPADRQLFANSRKGATPEWWEAFARLTVPEVLHVDMHNPVIYNNVRSWKKWD